MSSEPNGCNEPDVRNKQNELNKLNKLNKLNEERLEKERARMKVAYDHAKMWFGEIKKALEKDDGFFLEPSLGIQI